MNVSAINKHKQAALYFVQKTDKTAQVTYVGPNMETVLRAYREMWGDEPYSIGRVSDIPALIISSD